MKQSEIEGSLMEEISIAVCPDDYTAATNCLFSLSIGEVKVCCSCVGNLLVLGFCLGFRLAFDPFERLSLKYIFVMPRGGAGVTQF